MPQPWSPGRTTIHCTSCSTRAVTICTLEPLESLGGRGGRGGEGGGRRGEGDAVTLTLRECTGAHLKLRRFLLVVGSLAREAKMSSRMSSLCFS